MIRITNIFELPPDKLPDRMTKVIAVLRHAQSAGKQSGQHDYDRILTPDGEWSARALGKKLLKLGFGPDFILASGATRAKRTVDCMNETIQIPERKIRFEHALFDATNGHWLERIYNLHEEIQCVLIAGHNPHLSMLASTFAERLIDLAPCQLVVFEFEAANWKEITAQGRVILNIRE